MEPFLIVSFVFGLIVVTSAYINSRPRVLFLLKGNFLKFLKLVFNIISFSLGMALVVNQVIVAFLFVVNWIFNKNLILSDVLEVNSIIVLFILEISMFIFLIFSLLAVLSLLNEPTGETEKSEFCQLINLNIQRFNNRKSNTAYTLEFEIDILKKNINKIETLKNNYFSLIEILGYMNGSDNEERWRLIHLPTPGTINGIEDQIYQMKVKIFNKLIETKKNELNENEKKVLEILRNSNDSFYSIDLVELSEKLKVKHCETEQ